MKSLLPHNNFAGGLVSPKLDARADQEKYGSWLRQCQNMIPYKSGALTRLPGTHMIAPCKYATTPGHSYATRLLPFIFSTQTEFVLEFGDHYIRFYSNGQQVNISTAPIWQNGVYYFPGSFVTDPFDNLIYYTVTGEFMPGAPHDTPQVWTQQTILEVYTPYSADALTGSPFETDIWVVYPCQINDVVYLVHPDFAPYKLTRIADDNWTIEKVNFLTPALLDENVTNTTIASLSTTGVTQLNATAPAWATATYYSLDNSVLQGGLIYVCQSPHVSSVFATDLTGGLWKQTDIFNPLHEGSVWQLSYLRSAAYLEVDGVAATGFSNATSSTIKCVGSYEIHTYGVWSSDIAVQRSYDNGRTWATIATLTSRSDNNANITGTTVLPALFRFDITNSAALISPGATNPRVVFTATDAFIRGLVVITEYLNAYHVIGQVVTELESTNPTTYWSEAAWSDFRGFPRCVTAYQQRLIYASSGFQPQRIWGTKQNDLENFDRSDPSLADSGLAFDLNAPARGPILWLIAQSDLFVGFDGAEWVINSGSAVGGQGAGGSITATNINAVEQGTFGSAPFVQPAIVGNAVFFAQRQADAIRQMLFSVYTAKYMSQDMTALADILFASGIAQIAYQSRWHHQGILWGITRQGSLCGLTYDLSQEVFGWCIRLTGYDQKDAAGTSLPNDNGFESVTVLYGNGTSDDEVWVVANRLINGVQTRFVERVVPNNWEETFASAPTAPAPSLPDAFYVDCGKTVLNPGSLAIAGLDYLEGRWVVGLADGAAFGPVQVVGGVATLPPSIPTTVAKVQIGLPLVYAGQPMRIDADPRAGNTQNLVKQISDVYVRVWNSMGGAISNGTATYPLWVSGHAYDVSNRVISPLTAEAFECVIAVTSATDPSEDSTNWQPTTVPFFREPVPIPYTNSQADPFAVPQLVTVPTDKRITPQGDASPTPDPVFIVSGRDALPITVLAIGLKYDVTSTP